MTTLMAFDTSYLYFRAYFGLPSSLVSPDGHPVNAVRGTCDFLTRLLGQYSPEEVLCAWDEDWRPAWRVALVDTYKTHRLDADGAEEVEDDLSRQVPWIREVLDAVGLPVIGVADHEADDVLASAVRQHCGTGYVVSGDRDLFQLADDDTSVLYVGRSVAKHDVVTPEWLQAKYGLEPGRYVDFAVLRGDPSDGLPGVAGIGDKTAATLVAEYPSLEALLAAAEDPGSALRPAVRRNLLAAADYLPAARRVVTVVDDLPLPEHRLRGVDEVRVAELTERLGLGQSLRRLADAVVAMEQVQG